MRRIIIPLVALLIVAFSFAAVDASYLQFGAAYQMDYRFDGATQINDPEPELLTVAEGELGLTGPLSLRWDMQGEEMTGTLKYGILPGIHLLGGVSTLRLPVGADGNEMSPDIAYTAGVELGSQRGFHLRLRGKVLPELDPTIKVEGQVGYRYGIGTNLFVDVDAGVEEVRFMGADHFARRVVGGLSVGYSF